MIEEPAQSRTNDGRFGDNEPVIIQEPIRCLAAAVLLNAVKAKQVERTIIMEFWCDVVDIDPDVFFERASREVI